MKDTQGTNLPEEEGKLEETKMPAEEPENTTAEETSEVVSVAAGKITKEEILDKLAELVNDAAEVARADVEALKQAYYKIRRNEVEEEKAAFLENGGEEKDFVASEDEIENKIKELLTTYKEKKAAAMAEEERIKNENYARKLQLIDQLKALTESSDDFNKLYNDFKEIQQKWKEIKLLPAEHVNELWKNYQIYSEKFYDLIKINNQFRDYDFKKNLEMKTALCETVERLQTEPDVISAFHQLQKLHQQWREIGPVAKELREDLWARFKAASTVINKRHQEHFEKLKAKEQENLEAKTAICEQIEAIDFSTLKSFKDWENKNKEVIALQEKWKTIGFAPKKYNVKIFERFRAACDAYFNKKSEFYKTLKEEMEKNLELKKALCEKAEALKDSTNWKETTDQMIALQKEWKKVGSVARRYSDSIWKRFITACDYFFEQKNKNVVSQRSVEQQNLAAKKEVIAKIKALDENSDHNEAIATLKGYMAEWNSIGFVPFKDKDKIYKEYHEAVDKQFDRLKVDMNERKMQSFRNNLSSMADSNENGKGRLYSERDRLVRTYERMKNELQTYENNIGFLSVSSKGGGGLVKEMERKIEKLKEEMELVIKKIDTIDENLE
ncbi:MAG: DUF349 domain-containing protein [Parabacteroides sp.]